MRRNFIDSSFLACVLTGRLRAGFRFALLPTDRSAKPSGLR